MNPAVTAWDLLRDRLRKAQQPGERPWKETARPEQLLPAGDWLVWLLLAGRGFGKTASLCHAAQALVEQGKAGRIAFVAPTAADARDVLIEGPTGIMAVARGAQRPIYEPSKRRLTWPNGAIASVFSADEPDRLRGPQHDLAIVDELCAFTRGQQTWDMLMLGLRLGQRPRCLVATTPRPTKQLKELIAAPTTHVTRGTTYDNLANLAPTFRAQILSRYEGTRLGRQELNAEILTDTEGALFTLALLDATRVDTTPDLARIVVGVDPAASANEDSDETGIVVAGRGIDGRGYVLSDRSCRMSPDGWGRRAVQAFHDYRADRIVAEKNQGGEMVEHVIRTIDPDVPLTLVHAKRGKVLRAEPIAALWEQGRVSILGSLPKLEDQMTQFTADGGSGHDDRVDAVVYALVHCMVEHADRARVRVIGGAEEGNKWAGW